MKEFYSFNVTFNPQNSTNLSEDLATQYDELKIKYQNQSETLIQVDSTIDTANQIQQDFILNRPQVVINQAKILGKNLEDTETIYGKAAQTISNRQKVVETYMSHSDIDAARIQNLALNIDDRTISIDNLAEQVAKKYNQPATMDRILGYLKDEYKVVISPAQSNFLRTQWNQASIQGASTIFLGGFPACTVSFEDQNRPSYHVFNFNARRELVNTQYVSNIVDVRDNEKTGVFTTTADVSNLIGIGTGLLPINPWLPEHAPKTVSIDYKSSDIICNLAPEVHQSMEKHAKFDEQTINNKIYKIQNLIKNFKNWLKEKIPHLFPSPKPNVNNFEDQPKLPEQKQNLTTFEPQKGKFTEMVELQRQHSNNLEEKKTLHKL